jgi:hypothetical protein
MKVFFYEYYIKYGHGQGVVVAPDEARARDIIRFKEQDLISNRNNLYVNEIDCDVENIQSMTWCE